MVSLGCLMSVANPIQKEPPPAGADEGYSLTTGTYCSGTDAPAGPIAQEYTNLQRNTQSMTQVTGSEVAHIRRGYRRLAADVLTRALADHYLWHSQWAQKLRRDIAKVERGDQGGVRPGEWQRLGYKAAPLRTHLDLVVGSDPGKFLVEDSIWHEVAGVEPEKFRRIMSDPKQRRKARITIMGTRSSRSAGADRVS
jgi:hypothetical protein